MGIKKIKTRMASHPSKWSLIGIAAVVMGIMTWKYCYYFLLWSYNTTSVYFAQNKLNYRENVQVWLFETNCGFSRNCSDNSFPVYISTGTPTDRQPKLCVGGKYVIKPSAFENRGLNAAAVETKNFEVISVRNYDTYLYNKTLDIQKWVDSVLDSDILIVFTSDEASVKLTSSTKALFNKIGSGKIQNLQFRSQWYMITQKRGSGFTTFEKITYAKKKSWGEAIEIRGCVPRVIPKKHVTPDEPLKENHKKLQFCEGKTKDKYKGFCSESRFEMIMPALLTNKSLVGNLAFSLPTFVFASEDIEVLISALDSLIHQPGVPVPLITVLYEPNMEDVPGLTRIYGMRSSKINFGNTFQEKLKQARGICQKLYPDKDYLIVLDANVIPAPDFLFFIAQTLPVFEKDHYVSTISCWSSNCYRHNGSVHLVYRVMGIPKYAAVISTGNYDFYGEMFAPDVSRVQGPEACHLPSLEPDNWIERPQDLLKERYLYKLIFLQQLGQEIDYEDLIAHCSHSSVKNDTNVLYLPKDGSLSRVLRCLGVVDNHYGVYDGIVRLYVEGKTVLVITNISSFYKSRPIL